MHIYIQDSDRNYMKMNKNASVWTKLKFNFNFVHFSLVSLYRTPFIVFVRTYLPLVLVHFHYRDTIGIPKG